MTGDEIENIAVEWAAKEGWNPGIHDADCFYAADPNGFFVGLLNNKPVACISIVEYDRRFAFLGFYIVREECRGKGYGLTIWDHAMNHFKNHNIGLDGVIAQQHNYMKSGFEFAYRNIRYEGIAHHTEKQLSGIVSISKIPFEQLVQYDNSLFPATRDKFLRCWINQPESSALAAVKGGNISGYCVIRKCRIGYKIGPLFADTGEIAEQLFLASNSSASPGSKIYIDTPEVNIQSFLLAEKYGMQRVFETARMYTKTQPDIDLNKVFGVTTFELG
jgi:GNAT superfamily N-acetyltransferase